MNYLYIFADAMVSVIVIAACVEVLLYYRIWRDVNERTALMFDSLKNTLKGVSGGPDHDNRRSLQDEISAVLHFIEKLKFQNTKEYHKIIINAQRQDERKIDFANFGIETMANVGGAMVQVFPLLGILGTILSIAQSAAGETGVNGVLDPVSVTSSFSTAMDTTILGIFFGIVFMLVDSNFQGKISEFFDSSQRYRSFFDDVALRSGKL